MVQVLPINLAFRGALDVGVVFGRPPYMLVLDTVEAINTVEKQDG